MRKAAGPAAIEVDSDAFEDEVVTLIADSDSFEGFEQFDFSSLRLEVKSDRTPTVSPANGAVDKTLAEGNASFPNRIRQETQPVPNPVAKTSLGEVLQRVRRPLTKSLSQRLFLIAGLIALVAGLSYVGYRSLFLDSQVAVKSDLEGAPIGRKYVKALQDLNKAERVMLYLEQGYRERKLPESDLSRLAEVKQRLKDITLTEVELTNAAIQLRDGKKRDATRIISEHIKAMNALQKEIEGQSGWLKSRVFGG